MDAPAMFTRKHVPEDVGQVEEEGAAGGQAQLHRGDEKQQHKPAVLKKVKEKVKKIKNTLTGGHGHGHGNDGENFGGGDERMRDADAGDAVSDSSEEAEEDVVEREAALEKGGHMEDVEDKPAVMESDPEVHGAPMYESAKAPDLIAKYDQPARTPDLVTNYDQPARTPDLVAKYDQPARTPAVEEVKGDYGTAPKVRLGDIGGPVVEDPAAPRSTTPAAREGEDIGTTPVVQQFETMSLSDADPAHVGRAGNNNKDGAAAKAEEWKDKAADTAGGGGYTDRLKSAAAGTTEYGKKLASTVYEKVAGAGTAVGVGKARDDERTTWNTGAKEEEWRDAPDPEEATDANANATATARGAGYTDKVRSAAAGTAGYGKQLASTVYDKVAGVGTAVAPNLRPQEGSANAEGAHRSSKAVPVAGGEEWKDAPAAAAPDDATNTNTGYTEKIRSAAAGTTEYGKQLAITVYEKVAGVAGKVQHATQSAGTATPGVGAQQEQDRDATDATANGGGQNKGVTVTGYIAEKLRPGDEERALSGKISEAVQRRKEDVVGSTGTVAQRVPAPGEVIAKAREAVASLTGGNRFSETVQPATATGKEVKEGYATEAPVVRGEEIGAAKLNTNTM